MVTGNPTAAEGVVDKKTIEGHPNESIAIIHVSTQPSNYSYVATS
jgi:hypothetical protein